MSHTAALVRQSDWLRQLIGHTRDSTSRFDCSTPGTGWKIVRIFRDKTFEQGGYYVEGTDAVDQMRMEVLHFRAIAFVQNLQVRAFFNFGFSAVACCDTKKKNNCPQINAGFHR